MPEYSVEVSQTQMHDRERVTGLTPFSVTLATHGLELRRNTVQTLQVNVGLLCNQKCRHCHLEAGPHRTELMSRETMDQVVEYARLGQFPIVDITGGAPEMNPNLGYLIKHIAPFTSRIMLRCNLTALAEYGTDELIELCRKHNVVIVASLPATNESQTDSQRGSGVWEKSVNTLMRLNRAGYGLESSKLQLDIVSNPAGAFLPPAQTSVEKKFKRDLERKFQIVFNNLFTFANVPLGRFRTWLKQSSNLEDYLKRLSNGFNPCTIEGLMCRTLVSVSWDGYLFDCDFNLARRLHIGGRKTHITDAEGSPEAGSLIMTGDHCYACTAGSGFT